MKDPAFLFYPGDWMGGTAAMTRHVKGCYIDLLMVQFNSGPLSLEEIKIVLGSDFGQAWPALQKKFNQTEDGLFFNERLALEKEKRSKYVKSRSSNRKRTYDTSYEKDMIEHMEDRNEDANVIENENEDAAGSEISIAPWPTFDDWWQLYDKKVGAKKKIETKWGKLNQSVKEQAYRHSEEYVLATPNKQYRKNPMTYLNGESWNDEIINGKSTENDIEKIVADLG